MLMIVILIVFTLVLVQFEDDKYYKRYHQHEQVNTQIMTHLEFSQMETFLPVINIDTNGQKVPGAAVKGFESTYYELSEQGKPYIDVSLTVYDGEKEPEMNTARINYRGNSSRHFDKKSYAIRFIDNEGNDLNVPLFGMEADNNWALNGPYLDRSLIRNYLAMNWAGEIMSFAPDVRFVEVFVDDLYEGLYVLMEKNSRGAGRVPVQRPTHNSDKTGYIVRFDRNDKLDNRLNDFVMNTFKIHPSGTELRYPTEKRNTPERQKFVQQDFSSITYSMYQMPYDIHYSYENVLDVRAFYDYFIINELFHLTDAGQYSTYFYRNLRGKLTPVVWDFNNSLNNYQDSIYNGTGFIMTHSIFYQELLKDELFVTGLIHRYEHLRENKLATEYMHQYIDDTIEFLHSAILRNNERWDSVYDLSKYDSPNYLHPVERNVKSYEAAVQQVKDYLEIRAQWLDDNIDTLYQYSHQSRISHQAIK